MQAESAGLADAVSPVGARGLMQVMPATWRTLSARYRLGSDPFDPRANILAGAACLHEMFERYGSLVVALAAYNAGPARVDAWLAGTRALPEETSAYVAHVLAGIDNGDRLPARGGDLRSPDVLFAVADPVARPVRDRELLRASTSATGAPVNTDASPALVSGAPYWTEGLFVPAGWHDQP